jgi:NADH dehydrogenase (ubiquinone) 1 alpha subcomplex subunit 6
MSHLRTVGERERAAAGDGAAKPVSEEMAFIQRAVKVPPNSASLEEARHRVFDFFRQACRSIPSVMEIYNLDDVVTPAQLRSSISQQIRRNKGVSDPKVPPTSNPISI